MKVYILIRHSHFLDLEIIHVYLNREEAETECEKLQVKEKEQNIISLSDCITMNLASWYRNIYIVKEYNVICPSINIDEELVAKCFTKQEEK